MCGRKQTAFNKACCKIVFANYEVEQRSSTVSVTSVVTWVEKQYYRDILNGMSAWN